MSSSFCLESSWKGGNLTVHLLEVVGADDALQADEILEERLRALLVHLIIILRLVIQLVDGDRILIQVKEQSPQQLIKRLKTKMRILASSATYVVFTVTPFEVVRDLKTLHEDALVYIYRENTFKAQFKEIIGMFNRLKQESGGGIWWEESEILEEKQRDF